MTVATRWVFSSLALAIALTNSSLFAQDKPAAPKPEYPPLAEVTKGYELVASKAENGKSFYKIWKRAKDGQMLCELPRDFASQKHFIALTVSSGTPFAGLQANDMYVMWRKYDKRLALIQPNTAIKAEDALAKASVNRLFTDTVLLDLPISDDRSTGVARSSTWTSWWSGMRRLFLVPRCGLRNRNLPKLSKPRRSKRMSKSHTKFRWPMANSEFCIIRSA